MQRKKYNDKKKNEKLDEIDQLAKEDAEYLLKKANELRQEQEDEIKRLNEVDLLKKDKLKDKKRDLIF